MGQEEYPEIYIAKADLNVAEDELSGIENIVLRKAKNESTTKEELIKMLETSISQHRRTRKSHKEFCDTLMRRGGSDRA